MPCLAVAALHAAGGAGPGTASPTARSGHVLWQAGMERGDLSEWTEPAASQTGEFGGGEFDSGTGYAAVTTRHRRSGLRGLELALPEGRGGARLFRWRELRENRSVTVRTWLYFPRPYQVTGRFFDVFQFKSRRTDDRVDPVWYLDVENRGRRRMRLSLVWWPRTLEGPRRGQEGFRRFRQSSLDVPVRRWFRIRASLRQSSGFDGDLRVWQGRRLLFRLRGIRTSYRNCAYNAWCSSNEWSVNNYSDGLAPKPAVIYADDARISR